MNNYNLGKIAFVDRGIYDPEGTYNKWDFVTTQDSTYLCISLDPISGEHPTDDSFWKCIADGKPATLAAAAVNSSILSAGQLGSIKPTDAAPTPKRNGQYVFSIGGNKPAWLTAEAGVTTVKAGDGVAVVFTAPSSYTYTHIVTGSAIVQTLALKEQDKTPSVFATDLAIVQKTSWPLDETAKCLNAGLSFDIMRDFLVDIQLDGVRITGKYYSLATIKRNASGAWELNIYEETPVESGYPTVFKNVCSFATTNNPESLFAKITIHKLSEKNSSGITGQIAVKWGAIVAGSYFNAWASGSHMYRLSDLIFEKNKSNYILASEQAESNIILNKIDATFIDSVTYDSYTNKLSWSTLLPPSPYSTPFSGWGAVFNKAGIDFNAIKLPSIARTAGIVDARKWEYIQLVVKNSFNTSSILAISPKIRINKDLDTVESIIFPLMNSTLTEYITLNDASFSGSTYFIGYCFYSKDGTYAWGGRPNGTQTNYAGTTYYIDNKTFEPQPISWGVSGYACLPMEHALLTNVNIKKYSKEVDYLQSQINELKKEVEISLPDKIYAVVGDKLQLFYRGMIKVPNPYIYDILVSCSKGAQYPRYFEYTPVLGDVGTTTFKIEVKDKDGVVLGTKTCSLITKAVVQSPSTSKNILCVGDSLTSEGVWCQEASRRLVGTSGSPTGLGLNNISFLGRKQSGGIGFEGTGGWTWTNYSTVGIPAFRFYVSGIVTPPSIGSVYTNNGGTFTVAEINITSGTGNIRCTSVGTPSASGTLTKSSGTGDATITFNSSVADSGNPFWYSGALNFAEYVNVYMGGRCDTIYFLLTWNGITPNQTNFTSMITSAKTLINHVHAGFPDCKIKIMGIQIPSLNGGIGANYGAKGTGYADQYGLVRTVFNMNKAYQDWCNESAYNSFLEFVNISAQFDSENNIQIADVAVNSRSAVTEKRGTNGVHPATSGYYQIADVVFRNFIANFCQ